MADRNAPADDALVEEIEQHELLCALRLLRAPGLAEGHRSRLSALLEATVLRLVASDGAAWSAYGLQPIWVAETPDAPFADLLAGPIQANLDWLIEQQEPDGAWSPAWDWSFVDAAAWARAKRAWQGVLTLKTLRAHRVSLWALSVSWTVVARPATGSSESEVP